MSNRRLRSALRWKPKRSKYGREAARTRPAAGTGGLRSQAERKPPGAASHGDARFTVRPDMAPTGRPDRSPRPRSTGPGRSRSCRFRRRRPNQPNRSRRGFSASLEPGAVIVYPDPQAPKATTGQRTIGIHQRGTYFAYYTPSFAGQDSVPVPATAAETTLSGRPLEAMAGEELLECVRNTGLPGFECFP